MQVGRAIESQRYSPRGFTFLGRTASIGRTASSDP